MADPARPAGLRIVPATEERPSRWRRPPGSAVLLILFYAALFGGGLWWYRARSPLFRPRAVRFAPAQPGLGASARADGASPASPADPDKVPSTAAGVAALERRVTLLSGEGLASPEREEYVRRLSTECCTCGCDLALRVCLARDRSCMTSPAIAEKIRSSLQ
jgi:hypothetical protein